MKIKREGGESYGEVGRERKCWVGDFVLILTCVCWGGYIIPNYKNFCPKKFILLRKMLGYDARMSSSIFHVESPKVRSHRTLTTSISFSRSCFL